jgi:signal transduction histidine kinase
MPLFSNDRKQGLQCIAVAIMILFVTALHYATRQEKTLLHVVYRQLYFLPIILSGFWFGMRGGLAAALVVTTLYVPVVARSSGFSGHDLGNLLEILLFNIIGGLVGWLRDREAFQQEAGRRAEALASMGKAVSCIAHDMKTPLAAIGGFVHQVRRNLPEEDNTGKKLDIVLQQTERLEHLVGDMLAFARPLELDLRRGNLNEFIRKTVFIAGENARKLQVSLSFQPETVIPDLFFDAHRLEQAVSNLVNNAIEASSPGSKVIIRCSLNGKNVVVEVEDRGEGIPSNKVNECLQPFVSNKKEGTGLGLPIVKKVAEAHGGILQWEQHGEGGMIFRLVLPTTNSGKKMGST